MDDLINSEIYWDKRFNENWEACQGIEQTKFFAEIMCGLLPEWFIRNVRKDNYTICDMGCALGGAVDILSKFLSTSIDGCDFSKKAVKRAAEIYPSYSFKRVDLNDIPGDFKYDVILSSNVLEHFSDPWRIVENMTCASKRYIVLMFPYEETMIIDEHVYKFNSEVIPLNINQFSLIYCNAIDGAKVEKTCYAGQQILLVYSNDQSDKRITNLAELYKIKNKEMSNQLVELNTKRAEVCVLKQEVENAGKQNEYLIKQNEYLIKQNEYLIKQNEYLIKQLDKKYGIINKVTLEKDKLINELAQVKRKDEELGRKLGNYKEVENELIIAKNIIYDLQIKQNDLFNSFSWKLGSPLRSISKLLGISGLHQNVRNFKRNNIDDVSKSALLYYCAKNSGFAPIIKKVVPSNIRNKVARKYYIKQVADSLNPNADIIFGLKHFIESINVDEQIIMVISGVKYVDSEGQRNIRLVHEAKRKGIKVIYAYWRWDKEELEESDSSMFQIPLDVLYENKVSIFSEVLCSLTSKVLLIEFPHRYAMEILDIANSFGWTTIYDVIDDWEEFSKYGQAVWFDKKVELRIANNVDINIATANRLKEKISSQIEHTDNYYIISNGVDPSRMKKSEKLLKYDFTKGNLQIGYFGHLTDSWFDWGLIKRLAKKHRDWTFHIIGYGQPENLMVPNNVIMYGKKEPSELPKYAAYWDVAIIPFINSELTLSVNPIKIYEYLQLGIPAVTTNMPEVKRFPFTKLTVSEEEFEKAIIEMSKVKVEGEIVDKFISENTWERKLDDLLDSISRFNADKSYKVIYK